MPTYITIIDGIHYAEINSFIPGTFGLVWIPKQFVDVEEHWAKDTINNMASRMIVYGVEDNLYRPQQNVTRAEFATIIVRALGLISEEQSLEDSFIDVNREDWYYETIQIAQERGFVKGYGINQPQNSITRQEAMVIFARVMEFVGMEPQLTNLETDLLLNSFADQDAVASWAKEGVAAPVKMNLIKGYEDNTLRPTVQLTRAEAAVIIGRILQQRQLFNH